MRYSALNNQGVWADSIMVLKVESWVMMSLQACLLWCQM